MAASILSYKGQTQWDIWSTPTHGTQKLALTQQILEEIGIPLLASPQITEPSFGLRWDEGIILCSGMTDT